LLSPPLERTTRRYGFGVWPEPVQRVADYLRAAHADARLEEFEHETPTAEDAARWAGAELGEIVKSLVCDCDGRTVVVLVPGDRRADLTKVAAAAGATKARVVPRDLVKARTGFDAGAVAPFPLPDGTAVLVDQTLLGHDYVWIGAGSTRHLARLRPGELVRLAKARQMDAIMDPTYDSV
jgi:prolyl-tRNA editing enzyme YbaK/EbsC (Cys-tRNA(Pro) deacylase)